MSGWRKTIIISMTVSSMNDRIRFVSHICLRGMTQCKRLCVYNIRAVCTRLQNCTIGASLRRYRPSALRVETSSRNELLQRLLLGRPLTSTTGQTTSALNSWASAHRANGVS